MATNSEVEENESGSRPIRSAIDLQRMKLEKLMKNPLKPVFIPGSSREKKFPDAPEFVRNVMGSSAGAGSGEFHVYRHIRRREYARDIYLQQCRNKVNMDNEYKVKLEENKIISEQKTARKRKKRQKRKESIRNKRNKKNAQQDKSSSESSEDDNDEESAKSEEGKKDGNQKLLLLKQTLELAEKQNSG